MFFASVATKGVTGFDFVNVESKGLICTILGQFRSVFVSVANGGLKVPVFSTLTLGAAEASVRISHKVNKHMYAVMITACQGKSAQKNS
jgi:hypothetical protein